MAAANAPPLDLLGRRVVASYYPLGSELDPAPLVEILVAAGMMAVLPVTAPGRASLIFREARGWGRAADITTERSGGSARGGPSS
jgi:5-formyltetrahydrofolate cyclo-ligase